MKKLRKDVMNFGIAGVGLGVMSGVSGDSPEASRALGTMGRGLGVAGGVMMAGHAMRFIGNAVPKKKHMRF